MTLSPNAVPALIVPDLARDEQKAARTEVTPALRILRSDAKTIALPRFQTQHQLLADLGAVAGASRGGWTDPQ